MVAVVSARRTIPSSFIRGLCPSSVSLLLMLHEDDYEPPRPHHLSPVNEVNIVKLATTTAISLSGRGAGFRSRRNTIDMFMRRRALLRHTLHSSQLIFVKIVNCGGIGRVSHDNNSQRRQQNQQ